MRHTQWEYRTLRLDIGGWFGPNLDPAQLEAELNAQGAAGWELVNVFDLNAGEGRSTAVVALSTRQRP
jgi:hypothetical protein